MAKQLSTARKFKMITGKDLFQQQKAMDTELKKEDGEITDVMEFVQYGLYLALFQDNIVKAKSDFSDFRSNFEFYPMDFGSSSNRVRYLFEWR